MNPARFQTIEEIFLAALDQEPDQVSAFLDTACEGDAVLRREVEALLASDQRAGRFIETSSVGLATKVIQNQHADSLVGRTIGHYKISESIGTGGMGEVYLATDITAGRKAALKLLPLRFTGDPERLKRFEQEAHAVVALNHPNILTVYEIGEDHSIHYIASELIEGETLRQHLTRGRMELIEAVDVAIQVASALVAAHNAGIVHRDIKPENIMLRPDGYVKVLDFGIAKLAESAFAEPPSIAAATFGVPGATADGAGSVTLAATNLGSVLGTVRYMSPEQARGATVDKRTDIWSLGVVLYEMLTGHVPFTGDPPSQSYGAAGTPKEVMSAILEKEPPPLTSYKKQTPAELQQIIGKTLRKDREQRYQSARELLQALKDLRRKLEAELERAAAPLWLRWARSPAALALVVLVAALALALPFYRHRNLATSLPPDKSIAVLPFENLSDEKEHAAFADGVQDDILTKLAKIADLKVISQTSVMDYRGKRNLRQVGNDLGVSYVLEGSVRRSSTHLRLNAQLIDTRTDTHVWAQQYDRDLDDLFAIQSEIAQKVAERLNAKVTSAERLAIEEKPTTDPTAFELYSRAGDLLTADTFKAIDLLNQAVARDPSFLKAYCLLVVAHDGLYAFNFDHTPARLALAEAALREALRIRPNAGETHWARAFHLYKGYRDYDGALAELEVARRSLPNDPSVFNLMGSIQRRQGRWEESTRNLERAIELDPRDARILVQTAGSYGMFRRYAEQKSKLDRALSVAPNDVRIKTDRAFVEVDWKADTGPLHQVIDEIRANNPAAVPQVADRWLLCALAERDVTGAKDAFLASEFPLGDENVEFPRPFVEGVIARMAKDEHKAQLAFTAAREKQEKTVNAQPDYAPAWCVLGVIDAALGRKEEALREGRRAVELLPVEKDSINGLVMIKYLAMSAAWVGETDLAFEQLATAVRYPSGLELSYGELKLMPWWDPLRGDPRFEKILEESKNPVTLTTTLLPQKSIAVLPFVDLSETKDQEYFCDGMSEEILHALAKVDGLLVVGRTSSFSFKGKSVNAREVGEKLNVANVLEGSVRREGDRVRVTAELINARSGFHVWTETYDRELQGVFALQDEITHAIVDALKIKLAVSPPTRQQPNTEVYDLYLQGLYFSNKGSEEDLRRALSFFQRAVEKDPTFSRAWTGIAKVWYFLADVYVKPLDAYPLSRAAALKAIALDEKDAEAHCYLSEAKRVLDWDLAGADAELKRALELDPNSAPAHLFSGLHPLFRGDLKDGLRLVLEAQRSNPVSPITSYVTAAAYLANDRVDDAIVEGQRTLQLDPNYFYLDSVLAAAYREKGNFEDAIALYTKAEEATHLPSSGLAITYARIGRKIEAQNILAQLLQAREKRYVSAPLIAAVDVALGDKEGAFQELERAYAEHSGILQWIAFLPEFRALHSDVRFPDLVRRIGASQDTILAITETTLSETVDPNAQSHLTLKVGVKPRAGTENGHVVRIKVDFYDLTKDNKFKPTNAKVSYNWLSSGRDWTDPTPKFLEATYVRPRSKLPSPDERRFGGFVICVYFDGQLQDSRASPPELLTLHSSQN